MRHAMTLHRYPSVQIAFNPLLVGTVPSGLTLANGWGVVGYTLMGTSIGLDRRAQSCSIATLACVL